MDIRTATLADIPKIISLLKLSLGEKLMPKTEAFWIWKHIKNPFGESLVLIAEDNDEIIAVRAFMKWEWVCKGEIFSSLRAVDTAVHPAFQGQGLFTKLTSMLLEKAKLEGYDFIFNTPNKKSINGYFKLGWEKIGRIPVTIQFNKFFASKEALELCDIDRKLFIETSKKIIVGADGVKKNFDPKFLEWRYVDCPVHDYFFHTDGEFFMLIYRLRRTRLGWEMRIVELFFLKEIREIDFRHVLRSIREIQKNKLVNYTTIIGSKFEVGIKGAFTISKLKIGPILTIKDLNLNEMNAIVFDIGNWDFTLGDLELF